MSSRRTVRKIVANHNEYFDSQFWPVVVAMVVLSGITAGAILTMLQGPWMWGSLLGLPILVAATIAVLQQLDNRQLRRALQLAIVISMAIHMLVLVFASLTDIFGSERTTVTEQSMKKPQKIILISQKKPAKIWEEVKKHEVSEPEVEVERQPTTTQPEPQEIPVKPEPEVTKSQISKTSQRSQTVPRFDESLSELRKSENSRRQNNKRNAPKTSEQVAKTNSQPAESAKKSEALPSDAMASSERSAKSKSANAAPTKSADAKTSASKVSRAAERKATKSTESQTDAPSRSTARIRRSTTSMPKTAAKSAVKSTKVAASTTPSQTAPREISQPVTQRDQTSVVEKRSVRDLPTEQRSSIQNVVKSSSKRTSKSPAPPSISEPTASPINPRRSRRSAPVTTSTQPIESPSAAVAASNSGSSRMQPTASSVTLDKAGTVGSGASKNVAAKSGSTKSTATKASDMASRKRSTTSEAQPSLTATQRSTSRRSVANNRTVESAFKANTSASAKIAGSSTPSAATATASAATVDTASTAHRSEVSAQKGAAQLDIGPTKVVTESTAQRRAGGGGQPDVDQLQTDTVSRTRRSTGSRTPTLNADSGLETVAQNQPNSKPASSNQNMPAESEVVANRIAGTDGMTGQPTETTRQGPSSDHVASEVEGLLSENRSRRNRESSDASDSEEDEDEEEQRGNARTRLAQAPQTGSTRAFAVDTTDGDQTGGSVSESLAVGALEVAVNGRGSSNSAPAAGRLQLNADSSAPSIQSGSTRSTRSGTGEAESDAEVASTSKRRSKKRGNGTGLSAEATEIAGGAPKAGQNREGLQEAAAESLVEVDRGTQPGSIELQVDAARGPAGLAMDPSSRLGVRARPATKESDDIQTDVQTRFKRDRSGGTPALNPNAVIAKEAFRGRVPNQGGGGPQTEAAIELGLEFLARNQNPDGSWTLGGFDRSNTLHQNQLNSDAAATGLAVIAFQGAGYNHREFKYASKMNQAIDWLVENQSADGCLYVATDQRSNSSCRMYSHGIATLALTEAYGMTQDEKLREPIERALQYISDTQDPERGGWRYFAEPSLRSTDTSVSGWMLMALKSGQLSGFDVESKVFTQIDEWLNGARDADNPSLFRYNPYGKDTERISREAGRQVSPTMTSVGLLMRLYMGWNRNDSKFQAGADYLLEHLPSDKTVGDRDTYYWYYSTQVMRHAGGIHWEKWNERLHPLLVDSQQQTGEMAGSWHPYLPVPDRWGHAGGRLYVTTMNLLSLEVNYRLLPLYDETTK